MEHNLKVRIEQLSDCSHCLRSILADSGERDFRAVTCRERHKAQDAVSRHFLAVHLDFHD